MDGRDTVFSAIRSALGRSTGAPREALAAAEDYVRRHPVGVQAAGGWDPVERFSARAKALASTVERVGAWEEAPAAIARYLAASGLQARVVGWSSLARLGWAAAGVAFDARPANGDDLVGVTSAFCAVADTGTLMLLSGADTPAATSLLPETHIALVPVERVVPFMEDGWQLLRQEHGRLPRAVNFVSGPSRTADIEQTVTLGAHGPYRVHIILLGK